MDGRYWDANTNQVRWEPLNAELGALRAFKAESDIRLQDVPKAAADYKINLEGLEIPKGVDLKYNDQNPTLKAARDFAQKHNLTQSAFSEMVKLDAARVIGQRAQFSADIAAERTKLGDSSAARIEAVTTALTGRLGNQAKPLIAGLVTAEQVEAFESLLRSSIAPPPGSGGAPNTKPDTSKMSIIEKLHNARTNPQRKSA